MSRRFCEMGGGVDDAGCDPQLGTAQLSDHRHVKMSNWESTEMRELLSITGKHVYRHLEYGESYWDIFYVNKGYLHYFLYV